MYERVQGSKRLVRALENTENLVRLADILRYEPKQLEQDIKALGDILREPQSEQSERSR